MLSVGFIVENEEDLFFVFPEEQAEKMIETLKNAEIKGFSINKFKDYKGGGPVFVTRVIFKDDSSLDVSYQRANKKSFLIINGLYYYCDNQTIEKFSNIYYECKNLFDMTD